MCCNYVLWLGGALILWADKALEMHHNEAKIY
jgi:hypothetical protein